MDGKRPPGSPRLRWEDNIKTDLKKVVSDGVDWIQLAHNWNQWRAVVNTVMDLRILQKTGNLFSRQRLSASQKKLSSVELVIDWIEVPLYRIFEF